MDEDQKHAYETIISGHNLLLKGKVGTGKTFIINLQLHFCEKRGNA